MTYTSNSYQSRNLERTINKFYINIGEVNVHNGDVNNGIQHSISAQRTGDVHVYNNVENIVNNHQTNYIVNMDNRKVEFISPYSGREIESRGAGYLEQRGYQLLEDNSTGYEIQQRYENGITHGLLKKDRPVVQFIEDAEEIRDMVEETFFKLTGEEFPKDIAVRVCDDEQMKKAHTAFGGKWNPGIQGFAINEERKVFVRKNDLDILMLVLGHEIGHVLTNTLGDAVSEEAKAFAFEMAWVKTIIENDIRGLAANFEPDFVPAANGLHDKAFGFVQKMVKKGKEALELFKDLGRGMIKMDSQAKEAS